ncbi:MAG: hypothetical protein ABI353_04975 [Isosphaeraceae bacterium]
MPGELSPIESDELARHEAAIERGRKAFIEVGAALMAIHNDRLYRSNFGTFEDYCWERWGLSVRRAYQVLKAAEVAENVKNFSHCDPPDSDSQARALAPLPAPEQGEALIEARSLSNGKPTAKVVREVVDRRLSKAESYTAPEVQDIDFGQPSDDFEPPPPPLPPPLMTRINGQLAADPPEVAKARASGRIALDALVEIDEPEPTTATAEPEPEPIEDDLGDEEWLESLPVRAKLVGACRKWFEIDALLYRTLEHARKTFQHHASRALNVAKRKGGNGSYARRVSGFLKVNHPKHWILCCKPEDGGCGGAGMIGLIGECPRCKGRGYWIP